VATKKERVENEAAFCGGHHDGKTMVIDPKQDKIELDWVELQEEHRPGSMQLDVTGLTITTASGPGTITGKDTYYRNPDESGQFLFDDGRDYRLALYKMAEELARFKEETGRNIGSLAVAGLEREKKLVDRIAVVETENRRLFHAFRVLNFWLKKSAHRHFFKGNEYGGMELKEKAASTCYTVPSTSTNIIHCNNSTHTKAV
jgi:hypothetical protein